MKHSTALICYQYEYMCNEYPFYIYKAIILTVYRSTEQSLFSFYEHSMLPEIWQKAFCVGEKPQE